VHLLERDGRRIPLHRTEYSTDGVFAYRSARLVEWAEERSGGFFRAGDGIELGALERPEQLAEALATLAGRRRPAAGVPGADAMAALELVAAGLAQALERGEPAVVRCAPAFVGVLSGSAAPAFAAPPAARRVLVVCGSHVPTTTAQLERLEARRPGTLVEADLGKLAAGAKAESERLAAAASRLLRDGGLAVVATPRARAELRLEEGRAAARSLARVVPLVEPRPDVVVAKGGITSAVTLAEGLGAAEAEVVGPLLPGVSHWRAAETD